jgi:hypothetical protein
MLIPLVIPESIHGQKRAEEEEEDDEEEEK